MLIVGEVYVSRGLSPDECLLTSVKEGCILTPIKGFGWATFEPDGKNVYFNKNSFLNYFKLKKQ